MMVECTPSPERAAEQFERCHGDRLLGVPVVAVNRLQVCAGHGQARLHDFNVSESKVEHADPTFGGLQMYERQVKKSMLC